MCLTLGPPLSRPSVTWASKVAYEEETAGGLFRARPRNGLHYLYPPPTGQNSSCKTSAYEGLGYIVFQHFIFLPMCVLKTV